MIAQPLPGLASRVIRPPLRFQFWQPWQQNLYVLWFGGLIVSMSFSLVMPFLPLYLQDLGLRTNVAAWAGTILGAAFLAAALVAPLWGALADRFGQRAMLLRSGLSLAVLYVAMGLVQTPLQLAVLRVLFGLLSGFIPAATALISSNTPREHLGRALGALQTGTAAGSVLGPLAGGFVAHVYGYQGAFLVSGAGLLLGAALAYLFVGEHVTIRQGESPSLLADMAHLLRLPALARSYALLFLVQIALMLAAPVLPLIIQAKAGGAGALVVGLVFALAGISQVLGSPSAGRVGDRIGYPLALVIGLAAGAVLMIPQAWAPTLTILALGRFLFGFTLAWVTVSINVLVAEGAPEGSRGQAFGLLNGINSLGSVSGSLLGGLLGGELGVSTPLWAAVAILAMAAAVAARGQAKPNYLPQPNVL